MIKLQRNVFGIMFFHHNLSDTDRNLRIQVLMWMIKSFCSLTKRSEKGVIFRGGGGNNENELEQT